VNDILTPKQAAEYLQVSESTLRHWMCRRLIPYCKLVGKVRILRTDLEAWVLARRVPVLPISDDAGGGEANVAVKNNMLSSSLEETRTPAADKDVNSRFFVLAGVMDEERRIRNIQSHRSPPPLQVVATSSQFRRRNSSIPHAVASRGAALHAGGAS
jgi:excisionase family DNA binding protein